MGSLFGGKKPQLPEAPLPPPTINEAARAQDVSDAARRRRGRASTILVPDAGMGAASNGVGAAPMTGAKAILGA